MNTPDNSQAANSGANSEGQVTPPSFVENLSEDVVLSGGAMNGFIQGRDTVRTFLGSVKGLYKDFKIIYKEDTANYYTEEYTAVLEGHAVNGIVTIHKNEKGEYDQVVINHRPLSSLLLFSSLVSKLLEGKIDQNHFYRTEGQSLKDLTDYSDANGYK